ncbi:MAG TPA: phage tail sheath subtilisin-like domain-containing protein [bacterium]
MPEYLAPGVFVEEVSFRAKSIEGVSTTTTGFVGPTRYGPTHLEPEVVTSLVAFERVYGRPDPLNFSDLGRLHNYMWHAVRAFFEEGGKRLYVSRVFRPMVGIDGDPKSARYAPPPEKLADDKARPTNGLYREDGHARAWLTKSTAAVASAQGAVTALKNAFVRTSETVEEARRATAAAAVVAADASATETSKADADSLANRKAEAGKGAVDTLADTVQALRRPVEDAKTAYDGSTIEVKSVEAKYGDLKKAVDEAAKVEIAATVLAAAAADAYTRAQETVSKTAAVSALAGKLKQLPEAGDAVRKLAEALEGLCKAGGEAEKVCKKASDVADEAKKKGEEFGKKPGDANARKAAVDGAKALVEPSKAAAYQGATVLQGAVCIEAQTAADLGASPKPLPPPQQAIRDAVSAVRKAAVEAKSAADDALTAAMISAYPRAFAAAVAANCSKDLAGQVDTLSNATAETMANAIADAPGADHAGALLLRARFPGEAGNLTVRFTLRLGQNGLVHAGTQAEVRGLVSGDFVWIGKAAEGSSGTLLVARPSEDGKDWHFSETGKAADAKFWLRQPQPPKPNAARLVPGEDAVRISSVLVELIQDGGSPAWDGLSLQPDHRRAGAADSLSEKFKTSPGNGADARELPFVLLTEDSVATATDLFRTLFGQGSNDWTSPKASQLVAMHRLAGGNDGQRPRAAEYEGGVSDPDEPKTGLKAFEDLEDISIVAAPGATFGYGNGFKTDATRITGLLIAHAEHMRYRIAVLDSGNGLSIAQVLAMRAAFDSKHAALYYPWVMVLDPVTRAEIPLPPSGFVCGIYARNDIERAVFKAPANEVVRGALRFESMLNKAQQEVLNPEGINCFRFFEGRGHRLWGARTISSDSEWKYVNVRRYFAYLERSIDRGTQWAVFEPNGEALWGNIRRTIEDFLLNEWQNGALLGDKPEKAFFVKCDRSTMSQNDLDNGRLVCLVGVSPLKPAEFVIFRIGQWTADRKA